VNLAPETELQRLEIQPQAVVQTPVDEEMMEESGFERVTTELMKGVRT
jgi:hypothetical protein